MNESTFLNLNLKQIIYEPWEDQRIEHKCSHAWEGNFRYKIAKECMCFANAGGGYIVVGIDDKKRGRDKFEGVTNEHLKTWDTTSVADIVQECTDPPLSVELKEYSDDDEQRHFIVICVPSHGPTPVICKKDKQADSTMVLKRGALYFRDSGARCSEVRDSHDWQRIIGRCVAYHKEDLLEEINRLLQGEHKAERLDVDPKTVLSQYCTVCDHGVQKGVKDLVFREIVAWPTAEFSEIEVEEAKQALSKSCRDYRGWPFIFYLPRANSDISPRFGDGCISAKCKDFDGVPRFDAWQFNYRSGVFVAKNLTVESIAGKPTVFDPVIQAKLMSEVFIGLGRLYSSLEQTKNGSVGLYIRYSGVEGIRIGSIKPERMLRSTPPFEDNAVTLRTRGNPTTWVSQATLEASRAVVRLMKVLGYYESIEYDSLKSYGDKHLSREINLPNYE